MTKLIRFQQEEWIESTSSTYKSTALSPGSVEVMLSQKSISTRKKKKIWIVPNFTKGECRTSAYSKRRKMQIRKQSWSKRQLWELRHLLRIQKQNNAHQQIGSKPHWHVWCHQNPWKMPPLCSFPIASSISSSVTVSSIISSKPNQGIYFHEGPSTYSKVRCVAASIA